jgi:hypothetical protein
MAERFTPQPVVEVPDEELLEQYARADETFRRAQVTLDVLEMELMKRMEARGATGIPSAIFNCELQTTYSYDPSVLTPLKEMFLDTDLKACYIPEHPETVTVTEKWDARKVIPLAKRHSQAAQNIVERAKVVSRRKVVFERKGGK